MHKLRILIQTHYDLGQTTGMHYRLFKLFYEANLTITSTKEFVDQQNSRCFIRLVTYGNPNHNELKKRINAELPDDSTVYIASASSKNIVLMGTKEAHVIGDLLIRYSEGNLDANILAIVSNHASLQDLAQKFNIPFYHVPVQNDETRHSHEQKLIDVIEQIGEVDMIVLAKYMRILGSEFVNRFATKLVNIHHSFLPAFIGANPYKKAYERGVKLIGATAHMVTEHLDSGPIITQNTVKIDHSYDWNDLRVRGRDLEKVVLADAIKMLLADRVFIYHNKTVIL
jgi:formyltetrahydrofolate deformylase